MLHRYLGALSIICFPPGTDLCARASELFETLSAPANELATQVGDVSAYGMLTSNVGASGHPAGLPALHCTGTDALLVYNERCSRYIRCGYLQRQDAVMSSAAVSQVLTSIPGLLLEEHHANSLRMMGSLQMLANSTPEDILDNTDLEQSQ